MGLKITDFTFNPELCFVLHGHSMAQCTDKYMTSDIASFPKVRQGIYDIGLSFAAVL